MDPKIVNLGPSLRFEPRTGFPRIRRTRGTKKLRGWKRKDRVQMDAIDRARRRILDQIDQCIRTQLLGAFADEMLGHAADAAWERDFARQQRRHFAYAGGIIRPPAMINLNGV